MQLSRKLSLALLLMMISVAAIAKNVKPAHLYMFGFSASFKDSTVYITDIQDVAGAWIDSKTGFLIGRDGYSQQMRNYLATKHQQPERVCVVVYATSLKKAEKKYRKFQRIYVEKGKSSYVVHPLTSTDFSFTPEAVSEAE